MTIRTRLLGALVLVGIITALGTVAYMAVEDLAALDAFYLTIITISTVGFAEPTGGFTSGGQLVTIALVVAGVGTVFYTATTALEFTIDEFLGGTMQARREQRRISRMQGHVIICGYGRIGRHVHEFLEQDDRKVVVVETSDQVAQTIREAGLPVVVGDATDDRVLEDAGIDAAAVLIASVRSDPDNVAIVLSARAQRPNLRIIARANEPQTERKLSLAGADRVVTPALVGAARMASMAEESDLAEFIDLRFHGSLLELQVEECKLDGISVLVGRTLADSGIREGSGALVVAVVTATGEQIVNPEPGHILRLGQTIIAIGTSEQMSRFRELS